MFKRLFCITLLGLAGTASAASQPTLEHSAPFLGHALVIDIDSAPALQTVVLLYSPRIGHTPTPFGLFELERPTSQRIAIGTTDALGKASFSIPIPANASLAENQAHFQALVDDPTAIDGKVFSEAAHLRLLGTRIYAGLGRSKIDVFSAIRQHSVMRITFDPTLATNWEHGTAVFRHNQAVGAVMSSASQLVRFDPFFGALLGPVQFGPCSTTLLTDAAEERVFVLESGRITAVDLATGAIVGQLNLPNGTSGNWCSNSQRTEAYVGEYANGHPALRRIDLQSLTDLGSFSVANDDPNQSISCVVFANQTVFVTSQWQGWSPIDGNTGRGALTRIDLSPPQPIVTTQFIEGCTIERAVPVPATDQLALVVYGIPQSGPWGLVYYLTSLSQPAQLVNTGAVWTACCGTIVHFITDTAAQDSVVWAMGHGDPDDSRWGLARWDLTNLTWSAAKVWDLSAPRDLAPVHDDYVDCLYVGVPAQHIYDPVPTPPELFIVDQKTNTEVHIPLVSEPYVLHAVPVP